MEHRYDRLSGPEVEVDVSSGNEEASRPQANLSLGLEGEGVGRVSDSAGGKRQ